MIEHHKQGIGMAQLAQHHAQSSGIKQFAGKTADKQRKDIDEMKKMLGSDHAGTSHTSASTSHTSSHDTSGNIPRSEETSLPVKQAREGHASTSHSSDESLSPTGRTSDGSSHEKMKQETMSKLELRWTPKIGQRGSLTQNEENDQHVEEKTSA
jgi:uncharacterized protein (DUF305 family)